MNFNHIRDVKKFLKELALNLNIKILYTIGETSINILDGKIPNYFMLFSDVEIDKIYKNFENVIEIELHPFSFFFKYKEEEFFLIKLEENKIKSDQFIENYLYKICKKSLLIPLLYDIKKCIFKNIEILTSFNTNIEFNKNILFDKKNSKSRYFIYLIKKSICEEEDKDKINFLFDKSNHENIKIGSLIENNIKSLANLPYEKKIKISILFTILTSKESSILIEEFSKTNFFIDFFPILSKCKEHYQSKEYHPEGTLYDHLVLTSKEVESSDFALKIAALLHDIGKVETINLNYNSTKPKYPNHAIISFKIAKNYIKNLANFFNFIENLETKIEFLIVNHMKIAFLPDLDENQVEGIIKSRYLKDLLKLLKADLKASSADLNIYKRVNSFITKRANPNIIR